MFEITAKALHTAVVNGANRVISGKQFLNEINVFPVPDGDTGNNLTSMMSGVIRGSRDLGSIQATLESVADAALKNARGNSGIIFAQYLNGFCSGITMGETLNVYQFAEAARRAAESARRSIENPVEGTIITVMRVWSEVMSVSSNDYPDFCSTLDVALSAAETALKDTTRQLKKLKRVGVVDAGAQGFVLFVRGFSDYLRTGTADKTDHRLEYEPVLKEDETNFHIGVDADLTFRYCTEGYVEGAEIDLDKIRTELSKTGDSLVVAGSQRNVRIHLHTNDPAGVFERLHSYGCITYQKAEDMFRQHQVVTSQAHNIAIVTDSIADLPLEFMDVHQVHMIHLNVLFDGMCFLDRLTISPERLFACSREHPEFPTSSLPDSKQVEHLLEFLCSYYDQILVLTVSSALSGTYELIKKIAAAYPKRISVIDTLRNSGAQALLVKKAVELVESGLSLECIENQLKTAIPDTRILVSVNDIAHMIRSGRLNSRIGQIMSKLGLLPIVTLDDEGRGKLWGMTRRGSGCTSLIRNVRKVMKTRRIESYSIVHVCNPEDASKLAEVLTVITGMQPAFISETSSVVAIGAGPGAVAVSYLCLEKGGN